MVPLGSAWRSIKRSLLLGMSVGSRKEVTSSHAAEESVLAARGMRRERSSWRRRRM